MDTKKKKWVCAHCGYTSSGKFSGEICPKCDLPYWKCGKCGFLFTTLQPPEVCPECGEKNNFKDVTCYIPECKGQANIDKRL